jgi:AcrR family transcriptional regulator
MMADAMSLREERGESAAPEEMDAGQDPRKRRQILAGARNVFLEQGFDAASMNDIARRAGVSKGTLYVYFDNKERLFTALIQEERARLDFVLDHDDPDVAGVLARVGRQLVTFLTAPHVIKAKRWVIAIGKRMPEVAADFYRENPAVCLARLTGYLEAQVKAGRLAIEDCRLAANQFIDLAQAGLVKPLLYGAAETPTEADIARVVDSAVAVFLAAYQPALEKRAV